MKSGKGYIAISSAIVLSLVLILVAVALGSSSFFTRITLVDFNNKQASFAVARSCLNIALLKLAQNPSYAGNGIAEVSSSTCEIRPVTSSPPNKIIEVRSQINGATTNLRLTVVSLNLSTVSLEEVVKF